MGLPAVSIKRPISVLMVVAGIIMMGWLSLRRLPIELMPDYSFGDISIYVDIRGGMPPVEVENLVTKLVEDAVATVSSLRHIISISEEGRSRVVLTFEPGTNMDFAALETREKFSRVKNKLPPEIEKPVIAKFEQSDVPVLILAVIGQKYTTEMLRRLVDEQIKDRFLRINGVANIDVGGGRQRKILVEINQRKLQAFGLPIGKVINSLSLNNLNLLIGDIKKYKDKYLVRTMGEFENLNQIRQIGVAVAPGGAIIRLKDVAEVKDSFLEATSHSRVDTLPVVSLYIQKESTANAVEVCSEVLAEAANVADDLREDIVIKPTYDQSEYIKRAIASVKKSLIYGALLAMAVLFLFLRDLRATMIVAASIPISVIAVFNLMYFQKITLNVMTLSGLALGVGMLVDNSIVVLENIHKMRARGFSSVKASTAGSEEMLLAIAAATVTTVVVFLPIVFVNKEIRILYEGMALTITYSLIASLFVALTVVPMLSARMSFLPPAAGFKLRLRSPHTNVLVWGRRRNLKVAATGGDTAARMSFLPPAAPPKAGRRRRLGVFYRRTLAGALRFRYVLLAVVLLVFTITASLVFPKIPKEFVGGTEQEDFTVFVELPTGAKLDVSDQAVKQIEEITSALPEVKSVSSRIEPWSSKVYVKLVPLEQRTRTTKQVIEALRPEVKEVERRFMEAFIYFEEPQEIESNEVILEIFGHDYDILNELAVEMLTRMQKVDGLTDLKMRWRKGRPEWQLAVNKQKAGELGLSVKDIADTVHAQMRGLRATLYHTEGEEVEVVARLRKEDRKTLDMVRKLTLVLPNGRQVFLEQVVDFVPETGPSKIWRKNKNRMIQVSANRGYLAFGEAADKIKAVLAGMEFPGEYYWQFADNYWRMIRNQKELGFALALTLILIYLVLASLFESYAQPFIIMLTVPLGAIGVIITLERMGKSVNVGVLMGAILLGGIVVNNAIILIDEINRLAKKGMKGFKAVLSGCESRLRPIMMTTTTTVLGLLPMAAAKTAESNLWSPLAITVISGLIFSTVLTLGLIPCTYIVFEDVKKIIKKAQHSCPK